MAINYSLVLRLSNPSDKNSEQRIYPVAQYDKQITLRDVAEHLADHGSPFSVGTILGLLTDAVKCMTEHLKMGHRVDMDDLGDFYVTLSSDGAPTVEAFSPSQIKRVNLRWRNSERMEQALQSVGFNYVTTRGKQAQSRREEKEELAEALGQGGSSSDGGNSGPGDDSDLTD